MVTLRGISVCVWCIMFVYAMLIRYFFVCFSFFEGTYGFPEHDACKPSQGVSNQIFTGAMTFVMGIVTLVRLARNMPRKLTDATLYSSAMFGVDPMMKPHQLPAPTISTTEYLSMMKRMGELEEKVTLLSNKPAVMPPEKEEMLNAALSRVDVLEQELSSTKKVHIFFFFGSFRVV